jgi:hypothetical protein
MNNNNKSVKKAALLFKKRKLKAELPATQTLVKQANVLTFGKYDFSAWQLKGLVVVIEELQDITNMIIEQRKSLYN